MYPKSIRKLIEDFKSLPGVGAKTAERYALRILEKDEEEVEMFAEDLLNLKKKIRYCRICGNITEGEICDICADDSRNHAVICVVQEAKDIFALEKTGYKGVYHVLNGAISPAKGILPDHINIPSLLDRVDENVEEVILATNPTMNLTTSPPPSLTKSPTTKRMPPKRLRSPSP